MSDRVYYYEHFRTPVICLSGKRRSGKDFVYQNVLSKLGFTRMAYADALRQHVYESYLKGVVHCDLDDLSDPNFKDKMLLNYRVDPQDQLSRVITAYLHEHFPRGIDGELYWTPRLLMIAEGQFKRSVAPNYWINKVHERIQAAADERVAITDLRFRNEADQARARGAKLVRVDRSLQNRGLTTELDDPSETDLDAYPEWDAVWNNDGDLHALEAQVNASLQEWGISV